MTRDLAKRLEASKWYDFQVSVVETSPEAKIEMHSPSRDTKIQALAHHDDHILTTLTKSSSPAFRYEHVELHDTRPASKNEIDSKHSKRQSTHDMSLFVHLVAKHTPSSRNAPIIHAVVKKSEQRGEQLFT